MVNSLPGPVWKTFCQDRWCCSPGPAAGPGACRFVRAALRLRSRAARPSSHRQHQQSVRVIPRAVRSACARGLQGHRHTVNTNSLCVSFRARRAPPALAGCKAIVTPSTPTVCACHSARGALRLRSRAARPSSHRQHQQSVRVIPRAPRSACARGLQRQIHCHTISVDSQSLDERRIALYRHSCISVADMFAL